MTFTITSGAEHVASVSTADSEPTSTGGEARELTVNVFPKITASGNGFTLTSR